MTKRGVHLVPRRILHTSANGLHPINESRNVRSWGPFILSILNAAAHQGRLYLVSQRGFSAHPLREIILPIITNHMAVGAKNGTSICAASPTFVTPDRWELWTSQHACRYACESYYARKYEKRRLCPLQSALHSASVPYRLCSKVNHTQQTRISQSLALHLAPRIPSESSRSSGIQNSHIIVPVPHYDHRL